MFFDVPFEVKDLEIKLKLIKYKKLLRRKSKFIINEVIFVCTFTYEYVLWVCELVFDRYFFVNNVKFKM